MIHAKRLKATPSFQKSTGLSEPFIELEDSLHEQRERGYNSGFEHQNVEERIPRKTFEHPKSIISIALAYPTKAQEKCLEMKKRGQFARASWGIDYHHILQDRLQKLIAFIEEQAATEAEKEHWRFRPQVDRLQKINCFY